MQRLPNLLLITCVASVWLACSSSPKKPADAGAGGSGGATTDGAPSSDGPQTGADAAGDADASVGGADGSLDGDPIADAPVTDGGNADAETRADAADARMDVAITVDVALEVVPDRPTTNLPNGAPCEAKGQCRTGFCASGVCCATACDGFCNSCIFGKTGKPDGMCGPDQSLNKQKCGTVCSQLAMDVPAVLEKVCDNGNCVPAAVLKIVEICQKDDKCVSSFCDQSDPNTARCIHTVCPQQGTCCCGPQGGARMCAQRTTCTGERSCS